MKFSDITDSVINFIKRHAVIIIICCALFITNFILGVISSHIINDLPEQHLADRWSEDMRMAQVSIYVTEDQLVKEDDIRKFCYMLEQKLTEAGVIPDDEDEDKAGTHIIDTINIDDMNKEEEEEEAPSKTPLQMLYSVSYCAQGQVTITFENRTAEKAAAIGIGGDFFLFHPMTFVAGTSFSGDDLMKDSVVIDEEMAWQLFGSTDIIGQSVLIGNIPHYVVGVVKRDPGKIRKSATQNTSYVYTSYDSLSRYGTILSGTTEQQEISEDGSTANVGGINCIEVVCPNPVNGLAAKIAKESLGIADNFVSVIDNTDRFSFFSLVAVLKSFGKRSMWSKAIFYPYWENIARGYEDILALILFFRIICVTALVIIAVIVIIHAYRHKKWTVRSVAKYLSDKKYDLEVKYSKRKE